MHTILPDGIQKHTQTNIEIRQVLKGPPSLSLCSASRMGQAWGVCRCLVACRRIACLSSCVEEMQSCSSCADMQAALKR